MADNSPFFGPSINVMEPQKGTLLLRRGLCTSGCSSLVGSDGQGNFWVKGHGHFSRVRPSSRKETSNVFAIKTDADGQIIHGKEKACVVAQGYCQQPEDFGATAAPVAKLSSVHIILAWAALQDLKIYQFDCKTAFLHAKLCHDVYCHLSLAGRCLALVVF